MEGTYVTCSQVWLQTRGLSVVDTDAWAAPAGWAGTKMCYCLTGNHMLTLPKHIHTLFQTNNLIYRYHVSYSTNLVIQHLFESETLKPLHLSHWMRHQTSSETTVLDSTCRHSLQPIIPTLSTNIVDKGLSQFALVYIHLGDRAFLGMKAKSSKGKNSLGPMMPNPFVRFAWSLKKESNKNMRLKAHFSLYCVSQVSEVCS